MTTATAHARPHYQHLADAEWHLGNAIRALECAADSAGTAQALQRAQQLAGAARKVRRVTKHHANGERARRGVRPE